MRSTRHRNYVLLLGMEGCREAFLPSHKMIKGLGRKKKALQMWKSEFWGEERRLLITGGGLDWKHERGEKRGRTEHRFVLIRPQACT